jgi:ferric-dicitrate binding protein FerR (iron transport regulator)
MEQKQDISMLITDREFQKILSEWSSISGEGKAEVCQKYSLTENDVKSLQQLWFGLDFQEFEQPQIEVEAALDETLWKLTERNSVASRSLSRKLYDHFSRIAAILIIPVLIYTAYVQYGGQFKSRINNNLAQMVTVTSQSGTVTQLALPDGSKVYLNSGSTISYPSVFAADLRKVSLKGEGYFEVVKNKKVPMEVSAGNVSLKVYGTSFNVNALESAKFVKVTLIEGSVSLSSKGEKIEGKNEFFITPGQTVTYQQNTKDVTLQTDDTFLYTAWKNGIIIFRNKTFASVLQQLSEKFNVDIELKDNSLAAIPMDATFRDENINEILRLLALSTPFRYHYGEQQKLADGTFAKSKIYIERK